ncbi:RNA-binding protein 12B isoform X2 [Hemicordylus capensis]|uniref:RNA-binding protein 12B isoform X2 n=1 Tax=Hemicordylus capensis TaxID=884348 RepID=UPI002304778A|nr:RNA-binding protein 12B isoform X2 [Hemicordylus capensis]
MAVVIRLQGLPVVAGSADIRRFFSGLNIPDGGVHIIGGENGDAFIIFATDEDARQAMSYSGRFIKDSRIQLFLSSKTEMQNIIEISRKRFDRDGRETITGSRRMGSSNSEASGVRNLSNLVAAIKKGINKFNYGSMDPLEDKLRSNGSRKCDTNISKSNDNQPRNESDNLYLFVRGMPYSATEGDVLSFFSGLQVDEVIMLKRSDGRNNGDGVVKFATSSDALKGQQRNREFMGSRFLEVHPSNEDTWIAYGGRIDNKVDPPFRTEHFAHLNESFSSNREYSSRRESGYLTSRKHSHSRSPLRRVMAHSHSRSPPRRVMAHSRSPPRRVTAHSRSQSPPRRVIAHSHSRSPPRRIMVQTRSGSPSRGVMARTHSRSPPRRIMARTRSRSPRRVIPQTHSRSPRRVMAQTLSRSPPRRIITHSHSPLSGSTRSHLPHNKEYYILIKNLSAAVEKRDLRVFFGELNVTSNQITFLKPHDNEKRKKDAFVVFKSEREYETALGYHKNVIFGEPVHIFPISKKTVLELIESSETKRSPERQKKEKSNRDGYPSSKTCVYVRNFPFDVTNVEVQKFFAGFNIENSDIHLLYDDKGVGLGEALVKFRSEDQAQKAESLNRRRFLGTEVLLRCISEEQMQEFGINVSLISNEKMQNNLRAYDRSEHLYSLDSQGPAMQGNIKYPSDYRRPSDDFICSPDRFRAPPPFTELGAAGISGGFPHGRFMPDSHFSGGPDRITLIKIRNIPFRAAPNEILDFFHGYKIIPESLSIQQNEYGMPSGQAVVAVANYEEAMAVINELNDRPIGQRKARLTLA